MTPDEAGWYPDPHGRHDHRWFDGTSWTATIADGGVQGTDPRGTELGRVPHSARDEGWVQRQVRGQVGRTDGVGRRSAGDHGLLDADVLVVNQKAKLVELNNEYMVYDDHGKQVGAVRQVGQSTARKVLRFVSNLDQFLTHRLELTDEHGEVLLRVTRPAKLLKSTVVVERPDGSELGRIVQQNVFGKVRFALEADGASVGSLNAENWRAWDFAILDEAGTEVARIKKTFEGIARAVFTTADNYVVRVHRPLVDPLRSLVVAAAVTVDTALKQDDR